MAQSCPTPGPILPHTPVFGQFFQGTKTRTGSEVGQLDQMYEIKPVLSPFERDHPQPCPIISFLSKRDNASGPVLPHVPL